MSYAESSLRRVEESQSVLQARRRRWASLIVLCAALFLEAMNLSSINVQIPAIRQNLHLSTETAQFVVSAYLVTYAGFLLLGGRIADRLDRRLVFIGGVALFGLASLAGGLALDPTLLVVARAVQGIGAAFTAPAPSRSLSRPSIKVLSVTRLWGSIVGWELLDSLLGQWYQAC